MSVNQATDFLLIIKNKTNIQVNPRVLSVSFCPQSVSRNSDFTMGVASLTDTQRSRETTYLHLAFDPHGDIGISMAMTMGLSTPCCM